MSALLIIQSMINEELMLFSLLTSVNVQCALNMFSITNNQKSLHNIYLVKLIYFMVIIYNTQNIWYRLPKMFNIKLKNIYKGKNETN